MIPDKDQAKSNVVVFSIDDIKYAFYLQTIIGVVRATEITNLPNAPEAILGVVNLHGEVVPVVDLRILFHLSNREIDVDDQFLIVQTVKRKLVLVVDQVFDVVRLEDSKLIQDDQTMDLDYYLSGIMVFENNLALINDIEKFITPEDEECIDQAIERILG